MKKQLQGWGNIEKGRTSVTEHRFFECFIARHQITYVPNFGVD
jgi:hypothetical protein